MNANSLGYACAYLSTQKLLNRFLLNSLLRPLTGFISLNIGLSGRVLCIL
jgi:hypothetical protein